MIHNIPVIAVWYFYHGVMPRTGGDSLILLQDFSVPYHWPDGRIVHGLGNTVNRPELWH
jgi:hypothetical protein